MSSLYVASLDKEKLTSQLDRIRAKDPDLAKEYDEKKEANHPDLETMSARFHEITLELPTVDTPLREELPQRHDEAIALAHFRPVLIIRDNEVVPEFAGPDVAVWKDRIMEKRSLLNSVIPSIGRVEVSRNAVYKWVGTGWLIDTDIIVTNRHVASLFCSNKEGFAFKTGFPSGTQAATVDFLEEDKRANSLEFPIESVLWIAENDPSVPDVAFMRIRRTDTLSLPKPIPLADTVNDGEVVVTIGYPARDPDVPDQETVLRIFGDVYDKKRLAPGEVISVSDAELKHDCSTLGGNSGSPVISLATGKVVGLHFAGLYLQENYAVPISQLRELLDGVRHGALPRMRKQETTAGQTQSQPLLGLSSNQNNASMATYTFETQIPVKITLEIGGASVPTGTPGGNVMLTGNLPTNAANLDEAVALAKKAFSGVQGVISVDKGYRFRRGWITDERVIVVEVQEKLNFPQLKESGKPLIPQAFMGFGVDVRTAALPDQLAFLGFELPQLEAVPNPGAYREPPNLRLKPPQDKRMRAIFHVSPDSGWPNLKAFFSRVETSLTATMYEWEAEHISDALFAAVKNGHLKMVTQRKGTEEAVTALKKRLKVRFDHVWASVGSGGLFPSAYHIKVASRDAKEFWLSSGNWKDSNQADIDPAGEGSTRITPLREHNREWHVIIEN